MNDKAVELIRKARKAKGLKQEDIAKKLGVGKQAVSSWEKRVNDIDIDNFIAYCKVCGVSYLEIMRDAYGEDIEPRQTIDCTTDEIGLLKKYRSLDASAQRRVRRYLNAEYEDAIAVLGEDSQNVTGHG